VVEELFTRTQHDVLRYGEDLRSHLEMIFAQFYEQHSEIGAAEVQRQELSVLYKKKKTVTSFGIKKSVVGRN
jgi:hypothetical protein